MAVLTERGGKLIGFVVCCLVMAFIVKDYWVRLTEKHRKRLIVIQDGGVDDLSALMVLLGAKQSYNVAAVLVQPANSEGETAVFSTLYTLNALQVSNIAIASNTDRGSHEFPIEWREQAGLVADVLQRLDLPQHGYGNTLGAEAPAELLVRLLSEEPHTLVITGPVTYLAQAFRLKPAISRNIEHVYIMGGAVEVDGDVQESPKAEWNFYNSPNDARTVIHSSFAERITLIGLDVTRFLPVNEPLSRDRRYLDDLLLIQAKKGYMASIISFQLWNIVIRNKESFGSYHLWDTLAAVVAVKPAIVKTKKIRIRVRTDPPVEGWTEPAENGGPESVLINVAVGVNKEHFTKVFLNSLRY